MNIKQFAVVALVTVSCAVVPSYGQSANERKFQLAQTYKNSGDLPNAVRLFRELYESDKNNPLYLQAFIAALNESNAFAELNALYEEILAKKRTPEFLIPYGEVLFKSGKTTAAEQTWNEVLLNANNAIQLYISLAEAQIRVRATGMAVATIETARRKFNDENLFTNELTQLYGMVGKQELAVKEILKLLRQTGNSALAQGRISALLLTEGGTSKVEKTLMAEADAQPSDINVQRLYVAFLREAKEYERAVAVYEKIDELTNSGGRELLAFALAAQREGYFEAAQMGYSKIISYGPSNPNTMQALYGYVRVMEEVLSRETTGFEKTQLDSIEQRYQTIIKEYPQTQFAPQARLRLGILAEEYRNNSALAKRYYAEIRTLYKGSQPAAEAGLRLSDVFIAEGMLDSAEAICAEISRFGPGFQKEVDRSLFSLALLALYRGDIDSAKARFQQLTLNTDADIANDALEYATFFDDNDKEGALQALQIYGKAMYSVRRRQYKEAIEQFRSVQAMTPDLPMAELSLLRAANASVALADNAQARSHIEKLFAVYPKTIFGDAAIMLQGDMLLQEGNKQAAILEYTKLLAQYPSSTLIGTARSKIRTLRGDKNP